MWMPHKGQQKVWLALFVMMMMRVFVRCGRKWGKTDFALYCLYYFAMLFPNMNVYYIADTQKHAAELVWENSRLQNFLKGGKRRPGESIDKFRERQAKGQTIYNKWVRKINSSKMKVYLKNNSVIGVEGAENYANADGLEPSFIVYDELKSHDSRFHEAMEPNLDVYQAPLLSIGTPSEELDSNYYNIESAFRKHKYGKVFVMPSYMNSVLYPGGADDQSWLDLVKYYKARGDWDVLQREYMALRVVGGAKALFPHFKAPDIDYDTEEYKGHTDHVRPHEEVVWPIQRRPKDFDFYIGYDPASSSTFGVLLVCINRRSHKVHIVGEIYEQDRKKMSTGVIYPRSIEIAKSIYDYIEYWENKVYDNAATWFMNEVMYEFDDNLIPCEKDVKKKKDKISQINDIYRLNKVVVSDKCTNFIKETANYATDSKGRIPKENDHLIDNFRYILNAHNYQFSIEEGIDEEDERRAYSLEEEFENFGGYQDEYYDDY